MAARAMPAELAACLRRARLVELAAATARQRHYAIAATSRLMLAYLEAGWRIHEIGAELGLQRNTAGARIAEARRRGLTRAAVAVPGPPRPITRAQLTCQPVEQREWLTTAEAAALAGVSSYTVARWRRVGVLPNALLVFSSRPLYLRADIQRITRHARWRNGAFDLRAIRAEISQAGL